MGMWWVMGKKLRSSLNEKGLIKGLSLYYVPVSIGGVLVFRYRGNMGDV